MGYYSSYSLKIEDRRLSTPEDALKHFRECNPEAETALTADGSPEESTKWYDWQEDFLKLSHEYPDLLFAVTRRGEDSEDVEVGYFLNGKHQGGKAELRLPKFDEGV